MFLEYFFNPVRFDQTFMVSNIYRIERERKEAKHVADRTPSVVTSYEMLYLCVCNFISQSGAMSCALRCDTCTKRRKSNFTSAGTKKQCSGYFNGTFLLSGVKDEHLKLGMTP